MRLQVDADIQLSKRFALTAAFDIEAQALAIAGPSGSGKSTLLNGMLGALGGCRLQIDGEDLTGLPMHRRRLAYVPQDALLFPHMTVEQNIAFAGADDEAILEAASNLGIASLLQRSPRHLSGGERRRVAIARALAAKPRALLLDEPFTGLDDQRKREAMSLLHSIAGRYKIPLVLVTHVAEEAVTLTSEAIVLEQGRLVSMGPTTKVLPKGAMRADNFVEATVVGRNTVVAEGVTLSVSLPDDSAGKVRLSCPANDIVLVREKPVGLSARNVWQTRVTFIERAGEDALVWLERPAIRAALTRGAVEELGIEKGRSLYAIVKATSIAYLGPE